MPLITSSSGFEINGGNFYVVAGDMNICTLQPTIEQGSDLLRALESGLNSSTGQLMGAQRDGRQVGATRMLPYDLHEQLPLRGHCPHESEELLPPSESASLSSLSGPRTFSSSQPYGNVTPSTSPLPVKDVSKEAPACPQRKVIGCSSSRNHDPPKGPPPGITATPLRWVTLW
ncbi:hypothetical protein C8R45DRAFT_1099737 [Mycena sanguinolenta]|nr:hypothetical protein C8R45DRAFT_1099737 [Mycena sanguinolenta]